MKGFTLSIYNPLANGDSIRDWAGTGRRPPPSIYFTLTENISEICVCFELNQQVADTSNVCTVEIVKEAP